MRQFVPGVKTTTKRLSAKTWIAPLFSLEAPNVISGPGENGDVGPGGGAGLSGCFIGLHIGNSEARLALFLGVSRDQFPELGFI